MSFQFSLEKRFSTNYRKRKKKGSPFFLYPSSPSCSSKQAAASYHQHYLAQQHAAVSLDFPILRVKI